jgi:hypothetical protein
MAMRKDFLNTASTVEPIRTLPDMQEPSRLEEVVYSFLMAALLIAPWFFIPRA